MVSVGGDLSDLDNAFADREDNQALFSEDVAGCDHKLTAIGEPQDRSGWLGLMDRAHQSEWPPVPLCAVRLCGRGGGTK